VLLEGRSDVAAVRALAGARGLAEEADGFRLVDMGGVTNIQRELAGLRGGRVLGMCDAGEVRFVVQALRSRHDDVRDVGDLAAHGFVVCDRDLEDELIRGLGPPVVAGLLDGLGLADRFALFQRQPAWQDRPLHEQLHRFCGVASGRKSLLAGAMAAALDVATPPAPLAWLVEQLATQR
jgi:hypothetical protein